MQLNVKKLVMLLYIFHGIWFRWCHVELHTLKTKLTFKEHLLLQSYGMQY